MQNSAARRNMLLEVYMNWFDDDLLEVKVKIVNWQNLISLRLNAMIT